MYRLASVAFLLFLVAGQSSGVKWVQMTAGDPLPPRAVELFKSGEYVGRARHFNDILPAIVWLNATATIEVCGKKHTKHNFEVLTSSTLCSWQRLVMGEYLPEGLVPVGHHDGMKAVYIGVIDEYNYYPLSHTIRTFSLGKSLQDRFGDGLTVLVCPTERQWIDVSAKKVPKNAVYAGKSTDGKEAFVARLQKNCVIYPGEVLPDEGIATAFIEGELIEGRYCQVLIDDSNRYRWVSITNDVEFPDNAVVGSTDEHKLYYIAKLLPDNITTYVTDLFEGLHGNYELLIDNGKQVEPESPAHHSHIDDDFGSYGINEYDN